MVAAESTGIVVVLICWTVGESDQHLYLTSIPSCIERSFVKAYKRRCRVLTLGPQSSSNCPLCVRLQRWGGYLKSSWGERVQECMRSKRGHYPDNGVRFQRLLRCCQAFVPWGNHTIMATTENRVSSQPGSWSGPRALFRFPFTGATVHSSSNNRVCSQASGMSWLDETDLFQRHSKSAATCSR